MCPLSQSLYMKRLIVREKEERLRSGKDEEKGICDWEEGKGEY